MRFRLSRPTVLPGRQSTSSSGPSGATFYLLRSQRESGQQQDDGVIEKHGVIEASTPLTPLCSVSNAVSSAERARRRTSVGPMGTATIVPTVLSAPRPARCACAAVPSGDIGTLSLLVPMLRSRWNSCRRTGKER